MDKWPGISINFDEQERAARSENSRYTDPPPRPPGGGRPPPDRLSSAERYALYYKRPALFLRG